jgi:hypothetical protein
VICQIKRGTLDTLSVSSKNDNCLKSPARSDTAPVDKTPPPSRCKSVLLNKVEIHRNRRPATNQPGLKTSRQVRNRIWKEEAT